MVAGYMHSGTRLAAKTDAELAGDIVEVQVVQDEVETLDDASSSLPVGMHLVAAMGCSDL